MQRTQIYLTSEQAHALDAIATKQGTTRSALLRQGAEHVIASNPIIDDDADLMEKIAKYNPTALQYITPDMPRWKKSMLSIVGIWKDREDIGEDYIANLRQSWNRDLWTQADARDAAEGLTHANGLSEPSSPKSN